MEDDDEFGDLYTDVLRPFASSSSSSFSVQPHLLNPTPPSVHFPVDLNKHADDDNIVDGASHSNSVVSRLSKIQTLSPELPKPTAAGSAVIIPNSIAGDDRNGPGMEGKEVLAVEDRELPGRAFEDAKSDVESGVDPLRDQVGVKDVDLMDDDVKFDIEEGNTGVESEGFDSIIPGLSTGGVVVHGSTGNAENVEGYARNDIGHEGSDGGDDWDSDSEDDLQIVLNDNKHGPMALERGGIAGDDNDEDEDGALVIVADGDPNQAMEEQEWGDDSGQGADGERKEMGEAGKATGGTPMASKVGYSNHIYHPFHSQFKYVRPGAAPMPGPPTSGSVGAQGQIRPLINVGPIAGRGRGDWRPIGLKNSTTLQKGFHSGFGMPAWGNNMAARSFGGGLEFTLPSHKTIFEVDIDSFEEKPWKYPGVDPSDFFNFGLNEDSWKEYCTQLEQLRLESTMQSRIRVYESGRTEQDYDPDLPPELAAATGAHDLAAEHANSGKSNELQNDVAKGSARVRPPLPTGRAIQVESGYGERLPSIDTRPPRIRDSDAIIEIVLQDSLDDDVSTGNGTVDQQDNDDSSKDFRGGQGEGDMAQVDIEDHDNVPLAYDGRKRELSGRRMPNSVHEDLPEKDESLPFVREGSVRSPSSRGQSPVYHGEAIAPYEERRMQGRARDRSPHSTNKSERDRKLFDNQKEESVETMDGKESPLTQSPVTLRASKESSVEFKDVEDDEPVLEDGHFGMEKDGKYLYKTSTNDTLDEETEKKQILSALTEQPAHEDLDDGEDSKAARSSENSRARSGSSRDNKKWHDGVEEEVVQDRRSAGMESVKRELDESENSFRRKVRDERYDGERNRMLVKVREDSYPSRNWDPSSIHPLHVKSDGFDRRKEGDSDGGWQRRDDDPYSRIIRPDDMRKRERGDEMGSRHRGKVQEMEWNDKDSNHSRVNNGSYKVHYDKEVGSRHRERDDSMRSRYEHSEDYHIKRRKDEEYLRRDNLDREEMLHGHKEILSRRKQERNEVFDQRKRDDLQRMRDNVEDHRSVRHKDECSQKERDDRHREREEWQRLKQPYEENMPKREREGRGASRGGRGLEEKVWAGHAKVKDDYMKVSDKEYKLKDSMRHSEHSKKRDRIEHESSHHKGRENVYERGNQVSIEERRSRTEKSNSRNDHAITTSDNYRIHEKKRKESMRKNKESELVNHDHLGHSKRNQEDQSGYNDGTGLKGSGYQETDRHLSGKQGEDASSDDEHQDSRRGRSKLERWTSHKERDFSIKSKSLSMLKSSKDVDKNNKIPQAIKHHDGSVKTVEDVDNNQHPKSEEKDSSSYLEEKDTETKPMPSEDRHLDTVEKLKKRSERFKLPMPSEKETLAIKKMEQHEALPSNKNETPGDSVIKPERPARKRRWISG